MKNFDPTNSRILIYVDLSEDIEYDRIPIELFSSLDVILLGIYPVSDQATPEQTRDNFGEEAEETLETVKDNFALSHVEAETCLRFTSEPLETMNKIAYEKECDAILTPGEIEHLDQILIPVKGTEDSARMAKFTCDLLEESPKNITLIGFVEAEDRKSDHRSILEQFENDLVDGGLPDERIEIRVETVDSVEDGLIEQIDKYDVAVLGESESDLKDVVVDSVHEKVLQQTTVPLITVRFPDEEGRRQEMRDD